MKYFTIYKVHVKKAPNLNQKLSLYKGYSVQENM